MKTIEINRTRASAASCALVFGLLSIGGTVPDAQADASCELPPGVLDQEDLPEGSSVTVCDADGRIIESEAGLQLIVPDPGLTVGAEAILPDTGNISFEISTSLSGEISYEESAPGTSLPGDDTVTDEPDGAASTNPTTGCDRDKYVKTGERLPGNPTYRWYMGDGARPSNMTTETTLGELDDAATSWFNLKNPCNMSGPN